MLRGLTLSQWPLINLSIKFIPKQRMDYYIRLRQNISYLFKNRGEEFKEFKLEVNSLKQFIVKIKLYYFVFRLANFNTNDEDNCLYSLPKLIPLIASSFLPPTARARTLPASKWNRACISLIS